MSVWAALPREQGMVTSSPGDGDGSDGEADVI